MRAKIATQTSVENTIFTRDDVAFFRVALDQAWDRLPAKRRTPHNKAAMIASIARSFARGERDPGQISTLALQAVVSEANCELL